MTISAADILNQEFPHYELSAPWNKIVGEPAKNASILMFSGPGSGKSTVAMQLCDEMTRHGKTAFMVAEEGISATLKDKLERLELTNTAIKFFDPEDLDAIKKYVKDEKIDILCIDSFTIYDKRLKQFDEFRQWCKKNDVMFISIVQTTKEGKFYGNADAAFNVDCVIKVTDGKPSTEETGKNRLGELYTHDVDLRAKPVKPVKPEERKNAVAAALDMQSRPNPSEPEFYGIEVIDDPTLGVRENKAVSPDEIYQTITDMIVKTIEEDGELPFESRWRNTSIGSGKVATNFVSKNPYRGINFWLLNFEQKKGKLVPRKLENPYFLTFNQVDELGGKIKKGTESEMVIFFTRLYKYEWIDEKGERKEFGTYSRDKFIKWIESNQDKLTEIDRKATANQVAIQSIIPILRYYRVFNGEHIEGIDWGEIPENEAVKLPEDQKLVLAQALYDAYPGHPKVVNDEPDRAFYSIDKDIINMPPFSAFKEEQYYYSTLYHEAVHSTGAKKRLDRTFGRTQSDPKYWFEELVAELGAAYLCGESGILFRTIKDNAAYLKGYRDALVREMKDDNKFFFRAASRAQAAADYILDRNEKGIPAYREDMNQLVDAVNKGHKKKTYSEKEFKKEKPALWGSIRKDGSSKFGQFKPKFNKYSNKIEYAYYTEKGNRGTGGFTINKAWDLYQKGKLRLSKNDFVGKGKKEQPDPDFNNTEPEIVTVNELKEGDIVSTVSRMITEKGYYFLPTRLLEVIRINKKSVTLKPLNKNETVRLKKKAIRQSMSGEQEEVIPKFRRYDESQIPHRQLEFRANGINENLVHLGFVEQLNWDSDLDIPQGIKGNFFMFSSSDGKKLYIIPPQLVSQMKGKLDDKNAEKLYKQWNHFKADHKDLEIEFPSGKPQRFATAKQILYASDKIMQPGDKKGKINFYKHDFDAGKRPVAKLGDVLIVDNIKWDERGILN